MEEIISPDKNKNYLQPGDEPFFISSADGRQVEILRPADFWIDPVGESNVR